MKFILTLYVCSFLQQICTPPIVYPTPLDTWEECVNTALLKSKEMLQQEDSQKINELRLATQYSCVALEEI